MDLEIYLFSAFSSSEKSSDINFCASRNAHILHNYVITVFILKKICNHAFSIVFKEDKLISIFNLFPFSKKKSFFV